MCAMMQKLRMWLWSIGQGSEGRVYRSPVTLAGYGSRVPVTVRALSPSDDMAEITAMLHAAYARLAAMGLNYTAVDQSVDKTRSRFAEGSGLIAELDGQVVGTATVCPPGHEDADPWLSREDVAHLCQFAVDPACQGQGIGLALCQACESIAAEWGCQWLVLDTAEPAGHLVALYEKWGFAVVSRFQWPGKSYPSLVMAKQL